MRNHEGVQRNGWRYRDNPYRDHSPKQYQFLFLGAFLVNWFAITLAVMERILFYWLTTARKGHRFRYFTVSSRHHSAQSNALRTAESDRSAPRQRGKLSFESIRLMRSMVLQHFIT